MRKTTRPPSAGDRAGFILPFVLLALGAASLIAFAFTAEGMQSLRVVRGAMSAADMSNAADVAVAAALNSYQEDSLWTDPLGVERIRTLMANGQAITVRWQRSHPLVASVRASAATSPAMRVDAVRRDLYRALWLDPPKVPLVAALATNGPVYGREGAVISGVDIPLQESPCGAKRDTGSVVSVLADRIEGQPPGSWLGAPIAVPPPSSLHDELRMAIADVAVRVPALTVGKAPGLLPASRAWTAMRLRGDTVVVQGPAQFSGLLVVEGSLVLTGAIELRGLLLVAGPLDATAAQFSVQGAVVSADTDARGVMLGGQSRLIFDRCAVQMALATAARPTMVPFSLWFSLPR